MSLAVLDASFAGLITLTDEAPPDLALDLAGRLAEHDLIVPAHWPLELANMLLKVQRRGRLDTAGANALLAVVRNWHVAIDADGHARAWSETLLLAGRHGLTAYDAAYLELATRRDAVLASNDRALLRAARSLGVNILTAPE